METLLAVALGLALSAACGFRIFVPLLAVGAAQATGYLTLAPKFAWIGSTPALVVLGVATVIEIAAYHVPWLDHLLDTIASPAAIVAGIVVTASVVTDMDPLWRWTLAVIAGGGLAGAVQGSTVLVRAASTATTGGLANPVVATAELVGVGGDLDPGTAGSGAGSAGGDARHPAHHPLGAPAPRAPIGRHTAPRPPARRRHNYGESLAAHGGAEAARRVGGRDRACWDPAPSNTRCASWAGSRSRACCAAAAWSRPTSSFPTA